MPVAERNKLEPKGPEPDSEETKDHILLQFLNPSVLRYLICFLGLILLAFSGNTRNLSQRKRYC